MARTWTGPGLFFVGHELGENGNKQFCSELRNISINQIRFRYDKKSCFTSIKAYWENENSKS